MVDSRGIPSYEEARATFDRVRASLAETTDRVKAEAAAERLRHREAQAEFAARRRSGELGQAWQVLQQRIDMKQTTERDIFSGVDTSPEAREVRGMLQRNLQRVAVERAEALDSDELTPAVQQLKEAQQRLRDTLAKAKVHPDQV